MAREFRPALPATRPDASLGAKRKETPMLHNPPLLTIHRGHKRPSKALIEAFRGAQTSHLCDAMDGRGAVDWRIKPLDPENAVFCGPALTAYAYPADTVGMFGALHEAEPGDVLMVACDAFTGTAVLGDLAAGMMKNKGCAAFVTDGLARDKAGILATRLPVFAAGVSPNSPARNGPGVVGLPVTLGGIQVKSGDIVVGDADSVVVVPQGRAEAVLKALEEVRANEVVAEKRVREGATMSGPMEPIIAAARIVQG
jgi:4-hydroxy-4-methyl-2-oxoglutarate aldolase